MLLRPLQKVVEIFLAPFGVQIEVCSEGIFPYTPVPEEGGGRGVEQKEKEEYDLHCVGRQLRLSLLR